MLSYAKSATARPGDRLNGFENGKTQRFNSWEVGKWAYFPKKWSVPLMPYSNAISRPNRTYFMRWLIRTNSYDLICTILYDLSKPQWRVGLGVGFGVGHSYKFIRIVQLIKYVQFHKKTYEFVRVRSYELATLYVRIAVRSAAYSAGPYFIPSNLPHI